MLIYQQMERSSFLGHLCASLCCLIPEYFYVTSLLRSLHFAFDVHQRLTFMSRFSQTVMFFLPLTREGGVAPTVWWTLRILRLDPTNRDQSLYGGLYESKGT